MLRHRAQVLRKATVFHVMPRLATTTHRLSTMQLRTMQTIIMLVMQEEELQERSFKVESRISMSTNTFRI